MKIGIAGAGGIGSYYAGLLQRDGHSVCLLARGEHLAAIQARGLDMRLPDASFTAPVRATADGDALADAEYVIVAVKGYSLPEIGPTLAHSAANGAAIVPLLNGVDVAERLERLGVRREQIIGGLATVSLERTAPGVVQRHSPFDRIVVGELDHVARERTTRLVDALVHAGVDARMSDRIQLDLWRKFAFIVPMTVACGLTRGPVGPVLAAQRGRELISGSLHEIVAVSRARGEGALGDADEEQLRSNLFALSPAMRPSFLLDLERGGPTELDLLAGTVSRMGHERGVPTPIHDVATAVFEIATAPR